MTDHEGRISNQPKYKIGQAVRVNVKTNDKATGLTFNNIVEGWISQIKASGTSERDTYLYGVTLEIPACYFNGKEPFAFVEESRVVLCSSHGG